MKKVICAARVAKVASFERERRQIQHLAFGHEAILSPVRPAQFESLQAEIPDTI
jgi:hypothetical protein